MKKSLKEVFDMIQAVDSFCESTRPVWQATPAMVTAVNSLGIKKQSIIVTESQQEENNKGVTMTKREKKIALANETTAIAQGLQAYGSQHNNPEVYELMDIPYSRILRDKDSAAIAAATLVLMTGQGIPAEQREAYGISDAVLDTLAESIAHFSSASPTTRNVITRKTVLTDNCFTLVKEANTIVRKQILKIGRLFKSANPDFYAGLVANAKVQNHNVHAKIRLTVTSGDAEMPVQGAVVTVEGTPLTGLTNNRGECTITLVPAGKRNVTVSHPNYHELVISGVNFQRGHSITKAVNLVPQFDMPAPVVPARKRSVSK